MTVRLPFPDRRTAGRLLAERVAALEPEDPVVLALPRGGVPVAAEVAGALGAPLDLVIVRKIGAPGQPELAAGAAIDGEAPQVVRNESVTAMLGLSEEDLERLARAEFDEIERRRAAYVGDRPPVPLAGRTAILVDDGIATGTTARAALIGVRRRGAARTILAVPVAPADTVDSLRAEADAVVCLAEPEPFFGIGQFYADFHQVPDREVVTALASAAGSSAG